MTYDSRRLMWAEACAMLERAEKLHRQFFEPAGAPGARWEPPIDVFERSSEVWVIAALPGVEAEDLEIGLEGDTLIIAGRRPLPEAVRDARIHRLEIPYGRFERRVRLSAAGGLDPAGQDLRNGCLTLKLIKRS